MIVVKTKESLRSTATNILGSPEVCAPAEPKNQFPSFSRN
jgi:hypothetical protein